MCRDSGIYVCIEGLDGSGKSTIINRLENELKAEGIDIDIILPTKASKKSEKSLLEKIYKKNSFLAKSRIYRALLYASRSNKAANETNWNAKLILGDRSIVTSYVVGWEEGKYFNKFKFLKVDLLERSIYAPDYILFIDVSYEKLNERLNKRSVRDIDETFERSEKMRKAYKFFMEENNIKRLKKIKWHIINGDESKEIVYERVKRKVMEILNEHKIERKVF